MPFSNVSEEYAGERVKEILKKEGGCSCDLCFMDILSITCNNLPPRYVNTREGEIYKKIDLYRRQSKTDVDVAIYKALAIVREHPRHK